MIKLKKIFKSKRGLQTEIANRLQINPQNVSGWARGLTKVPIYAAQIMEKEFDIPKYISRPDIWSQEQNKG